MLVPTLLGRKYVPEIFQRCIDGQSLKDIGTWLMDEGVPGRKDSGRACDLGVLDDTGRHDLAIRDLF